MNAAVLDASRRSIDLAQISMTAVQKVLDACADDVMTRGEAEECRGFLEEVVTHALLVKGNLPMLVAQSEREATEAA